MWVIFGRIPGVILFALFAFSFLQAQAPPKTEEKPADEPSTSQPAHAIDPSDAAEQDPLSALTPTLSGEGAVHGPAGNLKIPTSEEAGESLDTLLVPGTPGTRVPLAAALETEPVEFPEFTREQLQLQWRPMDAVELWVVKPAGVKKPPVILYLYSFPSENDRYINNDFCKALTERGFAAVGFVSNLTGHRYHERPTKEWFVSQLQEALSTTVHDVQFILDYLTARGDLDMSRVGMWGDGSGASIAIMAAAVDPRIKVLDLLDPWGDWPNWLAKSTLVPEDERANYLKPEFLKKVENLDPVKWMPELRTRQVRLQYISSVKVTPDAAKKRIEESAPGNAQVIRYQDAKEFFVKSAPSGKGFEWIKQQLGSSAPTDEVNRITASEGSPTKTDSKP
jgi:hypothetical protein